MKKALLIVLFALLNCTCFAQKIHFSNSSNVWSYIDSTVGCCIRMPVSYTLGYYDSTPVNYNGHTYQYLISSMASFLTREDSGKVYAINLADSTERVLYDFNMGMNDTMRTIYPQDTLVVWPALIDSTQLGGLWYKVWHFTGKDISVIYPDSVRAVTYNVIEGIGCTNGPYYPASPYSLSAFSQQLLCFSNNIVIGTPLSNPVIAYGYNYINYYDNDVSCNMWHRVSDVAVPAVATQNNSAVVVPNPIQEQSNIVFSYTIPSGTLVLINGVGQEISCIAFHNKRQLLIGDKIKTTGIYYYRVTDDASGATFSGKFVY